MSELAAVSGGALWFVLVVLAAAGAGYFAYRALLVGLRMRLPDLPGGPAAAAPLVDPDPPQPPLGPEEPPRAPTLGEAVLVHCGRPLAWIFPAVAVRLALPAAVPPGWPVAHLDHLLSIVLIGLFAWLLACFTRAAEMVARAQFPVEVRDNLRARRIHTQIEVVRKIVVVIIAIVATAAFLMTFDRFREIGAGLLASAGLAGLIIGLAAQRTLGNLLAGIQIALTQPIRLDDVVIVEGEWGRVEEITLTYVVVRIWDQRRLVLPISWFIENPFQNWTRTSAEILGTVLLYADYRVPVADVRAELERILEGHPEWDGRVCRVHVTDASERGVELRCLMSAEDSGAAWELRCDVREKMLEWLQREHPGALPRVRAELERLPEGERDLALDGRASSAPAAGPERES